MQNIKKRMCHAGNVLPCAIIFMPQESCYSPILHLDIKALEASTFHRFNSAGFNNAHNIQRSAPTSLREKLYFLVSAKLCVMSFCNNYQGLG